MHRLFIYGYTNCMRITLSLLILALFASIKGFGQSTYHGIVVDSASVSGLSGVHIKIKNSPRGAISEPSGEFFIKATSMDTLLFTRVGHKTLELPLLFEENALFIRLTENVRLLSEITIQATRLNSSAIDRSERTLPRPMKPYEGVFSPFDYFSKWQKEKRMLLKYIEENNRTLTYLQVVSDQETRENMMDEFKLSEQQYYQLLAKFNQQSNTLQYSTNPAEIITALKSFLSKNIR